MKRTIIILIVLVAFGLGYWTGVINKMTDEKFDIVSEAIESSNQPLQENFDDFIYKFISDSLFQIERIKFPLETVVETYADMVETKSIELKDWEIVRLFGTESYRPQIYDNFNGELRDTNERLFCWIGIENGIYVEYRFQRIEGLWYLIGYDDFSD